MRNPPTPLPLFFSLVGCLFAVAIQFGFSVVRGCDISAVINIGEGSQVRGVIQQELGTSCLAPGIGHDGMWTYLLARDPFLTGDTPALINRAGESVVYRGRRILFSWLGGMFGTLGPLATLWGLILVGALGVGAAAYVFCSLIEAQRRSPLILFSLFLNLGMISSLITLTSDHLALGLALLGFLMQFRNHRNVAAVFLALAALTKETYSLAALSVFLIELRGGITLRATTKLLLTLLPLGMWVVYVGQLSVTESALEVRENLNWPFLGLVEASSLWGNGQGIEGVLFLLLTVASTLIVGILMCRLRSFEYAAIAGPWFLLMLCLGRPVWEVGNNAARAGSMIFALVGLASIITSLYPPQSRKGLGS